MARARRWPGWSHPVRCRSDRPAALAGGLWSRTGLAGCSLATAAGGAGRRRVRPAWAARVKSVAGRRIRVPSPPASPGRWPAPPGVVIRPVQDRRRRLMSARTRSRRGVIGRADPARGRRLAGTLVVGRTVPRGRSRRLGQSGRRGCGRAPAGHRDVPVTGTDLGPLLLRAPQVVDPIELLAPDGIAARRALPTAPPPPAPRLLIPRLVGFLARSVGTG
jgi:hypothetical protein